WRTKIHSLAYGTVAFYLGKHVTTMSNAILLC
ncbi:response regulator, partial [Vibrio harveyi]